MSQRVDDCGDLEPTGRDTWVTPTPAPACRRGHPYGPYKVSVGTKACDCPGQPHNIHMTWYCRTCGDVRTCGIQPYRHTSDGNGGGSGTG